MFLKSTDAVTHESPTPIPQKIVFFLYILLNKDKFSDKASGIDAEDVFPVFSARKGIFEISKFNIEHTEFKRNLFDW